MKIYTKTGDAGESGLFGGERVPKDHPRLEAYGSLDELNSVVGWLRTALEDEEVDRLLAQVQHKLFDIGAELATPDPERWGKQSALVSETDIQVLELAIDQWDQDLAPLTAFVLPGGVEAAARAHLMRTVIRRVERQVITLSREAAISDYVIPYLNRLSDFSFVLARVLNKRAGMSDVLWNK